VHPRRLNGAVAVLFLAAGALGIAAVWRGLLEWRPRDLQWSIARVNMAGSAFFMLCAIGSLVLPITGSVANAKWANAETFAGALCSSSGPRCCCRHGGRPRPDSGDSVSARWLGATRLRSCDGRAIPSSCV